jgi:hypothetical protein
MAKDTEEEKRKALEAKIESLEALEKTMIAETDSTIQSLAEVSKPEKELKESFELAKKKSRA